MVDSLLAPYIERPAAAALLTRLAQSLKSPNLSPLLLHVWGVGGVGKTTLAGQAREANPQAATAFVEFGRREGSNETIGLLKALHRDLVPQFKGQPDPFGKLYNEYFDAIHKLKTESEDGKGAATPEQIEIVKKNLVWAAKGLGGLTPVGSEMAGAAAGAVVESSTLIASEADRLRNLVQRHRATKGKRELQELILAPVPRLTDAFVETLTQWSKRCPILLILDTYEKASAEVDSWLWASLLGNHANLRDLPVRILVTGRHELRNEGWRKLKQDRPGWIDERSLRRLEPEQTQDYLQRIGITDATQIERITKVTKGLPYYLNWIREKQHQGEQLTFVEGNEAIAELLLQGLDEAKRQMIELAACCRWFDRTLLDSLGQQFKLTMDFDWLVQQSFVERLGQNYRLDDVARDVFRQEFWRNYRPKFEQAFEALMRYFKGLSDREAPAACPAPDRYENEQWRILRTEYLYYLLFTRKPDLQLIWIGHLLEARYFRQDSLVQVPLQAIDSETLEVQHPYLSSPTSQWLQQLRPAIERGWAVLEQDPIDYPYNLERFGLTREATHRAIELCLRPVEQLNGLAKFAALFYRSRRCPESERWERLLVAKAQAEQIATEAHPEFSSDLFLYRIGASFYKLGRHEEAISSCDKALQVNLDDHEAWYSRGLALYALGRHEEAISSYDKALQVNPDYHAAWNNRGLALSDLGRHEEAVSSYDKALQVNPDDHAAWNNRGNALYALGRKEEAISNYDKALQVNPDYHAAWNNQGNALYALGRHEEAVSSYDKALQVKPDKHAAWNNRGNALYALGRHEEAVSSYDKALQVNPDDHVAWNNRGNALSDLGRHEEAISSYDKALQVNPDYHAAWYNRGVALSALGRHEEAISSYDKALQVNPDDHEAWNNRGVALSDLGRKEEAASSYDKALQVKPDFHAAWYNKACCYALMGEVPEAVDCLSRAIALDPKSRELAKTDADFDAIRGEDWFQGVLEG